MTALGSPLVPHCQWFGFRISSIRHSLDIDTATWHSRFAPPGRGSMWFRCAVINLKWLITLINKKRIKLFQLITANSGPVSVKRRNLICLKTDLWPIRMNVWHIVIFQHFIRHQWHFMSSLFPRHCDCLNAQRCAQCYEWLRHHRHSTDPFHSTVLQTERFVRAGCGDSAQTNWGVSEWVEKIVIKRKPDAGNDIFIFMSFSSQVIPRVIK